MPEPCHIFVYGTLCCGQCRESVWPEGGHPPLDSDLVEPAFVYGALYDLGPYPAIVEGHDWVAGEIRCYKNRSLLETLKLLDEIEGYVEGRSGNLYERLVVRAYAAAEASSKSIPAYVYRMLPNRLPGLARRIAPRHHTADSNLPYCRWPDDQRSATERDELPEPFPDW